MTTLNIPDEAARRYPYRLGSTEPIMMDDSLPYLLRKAFAEGAELGQRQALRPLLDYRTECATLEAEPTIAGIDRALATAVLGDA